MHLYRLRCPQICSQKAEMQERWLCGFSPCAKPKKQEKQEREWCKFQSD